ncbi:D-alanyl-D-alanine carboxypeptidase family protein [Patescibacteria group bacterium]|nr:D-alanyl-D-alanine carboxypeptidase family protein [Patescibacteria group bacterium]
MPTSEPSNPFIPGEDQAKLDRVPIQDNGEPLVDFLLLSPRLTLSPSRHRFDFPRTHLIRQSVAEMLLAAAETLPVGWRLSVAEGYRPMNIQRAMYQSALHEVKTEHPDWNDRQVMTEAGRRSAPPDAPTPPPHTTGGAVDLEIIDQSGQTLDFSSPFSRTDWRQAAPGSPGLTEEAIANRKLLRNLLEPTGLTNYVDEWWHWSYGDNGWALRVGADHALYDRVPTPESIDWIGDISKLPGN